MRWDVPLREVMKLGTHRSRNGDPSHVHPAWKKSGSRYLELLLNTEERRLMLGY